MEWAAHGFSRAIAGLKACATPPPHPFPARGFTRQRADGYLQF